MRITILLAFALCLSLPACRKRSTPGGTSESPSGGSGSQAQQSAAGNSTGNPFLDKAVATGNPQAVLQAFNQIIEARFMTATSPLTNLNQLVTEGTLAQLPDGPSGRKYQFDTAARQVVLR